MGKLQASIIIPTRNEEEAIARSCVLFQRKFKKKTEIIVVDSSEDKTLGIC
jgi:glycosyltransferase involved in cell wall biosynthesis